MPATNEKATPRGAALIETIRLEGREALAHVPLPDRAQHLWRYTDPTEVVPPEIVSASDGGPPRLDLETVVEADEAARAVGVLVLPLWQAAEALPEQVASIFGRLVPAAFGRPESLNASLWSAGHFVKIPRGAQVEVPIRILTTLAGAKGFRAVRNLIVVEEDASVTIVEESRGPDGSGAGAIVNEVTELFVAPGGQVRYAPIQHVGKKVVSHRTVRARLDREARLQMAIASFGAGLYKADLRVDLAGEGAESRMTGVVYGDGRQRADHHTVHDHVAPRTFSDIDFRVALADRARSAYTGLIRIAKNAPHCEAYQENKNLLLSEESRAESIPELEILTDEVRCKHGAAVGPVDPDQLFYLNSRGLAHADAMRIVVGGFLEQTLSQIPGTVADSLREETSRRLGGLSR
ncbi:MAG: Fe-S cluster assembly protein SufD [Candidatus Eisenbacteria bacterium]